MPQANSRFSRPRATSPSASDGTLPCSAVRKAAISCDVRLDEVRGCGTGSRSASQSEVARQAGKAAFAAATAASTSATEAKSTSRGELRRSPGRRPGRVRPDVPATSRPPIQWPTRSRPAESRSRRSAPSSCGGFSDLCHLDLASSGSSRSSVAVRLGRRWAPMGGQGYPAARAGPDRGPPATSARGSAAVRSAAGPPAAARPAHPAAVAPRAAWNRTRPAFQRASHRPATAATPTPIAMMPPAGIGPRTASSRQVVVTTSRPIAQMRRATKNADPLAPLNPPSQTTTADRHERHRGRDRAVAPGTDRTGSPGRGSPTAPGRDRPSTRPRRSGSPGRCRRGSGRPRRGRWRGRPAPPPRGTSARRAHRAGAPRTPR